MRQKLHWTYYMPGALFLIIGILSLAACVMINIQESDGNIERGVVHAEDIEDQTEEPPSGE